MPIKWVSRSRHSQVEFSSIRPRLETQFKVKSRSHSSRVGDATRWKRATVCCYNFSLKVIDSSRLTALTELNGAAGVAAGVGSSALPLMLMSADAAVAQPSHIMTSHCEQTSVCSVILPVIISLLNNVASGVNDNAVVNELSPLKYISATVTVDDTSNKYYFCNGRRWHNNCCFSGKLFAPRWYRKIITWYCWPTSGSHWDWTCGQFSW